MRGKRGQPIQEGYRRTLQHALQWYDILLHAVELSVRVRLEPAITNPTMPLPVVADAVSSSPAGRLASPPETPVSVQRVTRNTPATAALLISPFPTCDDGVDDDDDSTGPATSPPSSPPPTPRPTRAAPSPSWRIWGAVAEGLGLKIGGRTTVDQTLIDRCPACFGFTNPGTPILQYVAIARRRRHSFNAEVATCMSPVTATSCTVTTKTLATVPRSRLTSASSCRRRSSSPSTDHSTMLARGRHARTNPRSPNRSSNSAPIRTRPATDLERRRAATRSTTAGSWSWSVATTFPYTLATSTHPANSKCTSSQCSSGYSCISPIRRRLEAGTTSIA